MSVHQLPDGRWICKYKDPSTGNPKKEYFGRGEESERKAIARNTELGIGVASKKASTPIFFSLARAYLISRSSTLAPSTLASLEYKLDSVILPRLGNVHAHNITPEAIDAYVAWRREGGVKFCTIAADLTYIKAIISHAFKRGLIISDPIADYKKPRNDGERIRPPSRPELDAILGHARPHLRRALLLAYYTGMRVGPSELFGLRWPDVDFFGRMIMVASADKGGPAIRNIPISTKFIDTLRAWKDEDEKGKYPRCQYVISYAGKRVIDLGAAWRSAKKKAGITRRIRLYDLRHMAATTLLENGAGMKAVSKILGHASPATTITTYQHVMDSQVVEDIEKL